MTDNPSDNQKDMMQVLDDYFNRGVEKKKFIDVTRIPLICQDISNIHQTLEDMKNNQTWLVRLIIAGIVAAVFSLILKQ